uniref:RecA family profile 1 domain-containing protein n=1 Tax=Timema genevievae TaxID=629358 RepID=A0A7R9K1D3_TIMGE|nr:unnamed protein product [Timema genevievae]
MEPEETTRVYSLLLLLKYSLDETSEYDIACNCVWQFKSLELAVVWRDRLFILIRGMDSLPVDSETTTHIHSTIIRAISEILVSNKTNITVKIEPHKFLTVCKGVVTCFDLDCVSIELDTQYVTKVYRIATKRNSTVKTIDTYIFTFTNPTPPKEVEQGSLCSGSGCMSPFIGVVFSVRSLVISSCNAVVSQPVQEVHNTLCESPKFFVNYKDIVASCVSHCHLQGVKEFTVDRAMAGVHYIPVHDVIELMAALHLVHSFINKNGKKPLISYKKPNNPYKKPNNPYKKPLIPYKKPNNPYKKPNNPYKKPNNPYNIPYRCRGRTHLCGVYKQLTNSTGHQFCSGSVHQCTNLKRSPRVSTQLRLSLSYFTAPYCAKILLPPPHHPCVPYIDLNNITGWTSVAEIFELSSAYHCVKLVVVDSLTFPFLHNSSNSLSKTRLLSLAVEKLHVIANQHNVSVVLTNQLSTRVCPGMESNLIPSQGESYGQSMNQRLIVGCYHNNRHAAVLFKSVTTPSTSAMFQRMNNHRFDTNHKDPDQPVPIHAGTHNQDFQTCYTTKIIRAFPKQCNSSHLRQWELPHQWINKSRSPPGLNRR